MAGGGAVAQRPCERKIGTTESHRDAAGRLTGIAYTSGATTIGTLSYGDDLAGRIVSRGGTLFQSVLPAAVTSATYDAANRLTARTAAGSTVSPTWDLNGNLLTDGLHSYSWDSRNRLTAITGVARYVYDAFGRRRTNTLGTAATAYLYDGGDSIQEQNASGSVTANLLTGAGIDKRFTRATTGTGAATSSYLTDALGSAVALASSSGTVRTNDGYDPYGATGTSGTANTSPYPFTGRENDGTGLYFHRARYYNPIWGRFISEDPIGLAGGINLYRYAGNNPLSFRDPSGLVPLGAFPPLFPSNPTPPTGPIKSAGSPNGSPEPGIPPKPPSIDPGGVDPSTPVGRRGDKSNPNLQPKYVGQPMNVVRGTNDPTTIDGIDYSGHAIDEMQSEGFTSTIVQNATIVDPDGVKQIDGNIAHYDLVNNITVVTNPQGRIVTVNSGDLR